MLWSCLDPCKLPKSLNELYNRDSSTMSDSDTFTLVTASSHHQIFDDYVNINAGKVYNPHTYLQAALRRQYPELALTVTVANNSKFGLASHFPI